MALMRTILGVICCCTLYLFPFGIALLRNRENKLMIFFINFIGGAVFIGWVIAFFMSLKSRDQRVTES